MSQVNNITSTTTTVVKRRQTNDTSHVKRRKSLNRRSKIFYVTCDYVDVNRNGEMKTEMVLNVQSDPLNIMVGQGERNKRDKRQAMTIDEEFDPLNIMVGQGERNKSDKRQAMTIDEEFDPLDTTASHGDVNRRDKRMTMKDKFDPLNSPIDENGGHQSNKSKRHGMQIDDNFDPLNIIIDEAHSKEKKSQQKNGGGKQKRRSKLFYVSCEHFEIASPNSKLSSGGNLRSTPLNASSDSFQSSLLYSSAEDETPINSSSSGRSTPSSGVKKRPRRPDINLSPYKDYIEIKRPESVYSESDRCSFVSESSYMDITEDHVARAVLETVNQELEETLKEEPTQQTNGFHHAQIEQSQLEVLCSERPGSPTSEFFSSLLSSVDDTNHNESLVTRLHRKLSPFFHRVAKLEADAKKVEGLQVKLAVVQEEKRQLSSMLKQRRRTNSENEADLTTKLYNQEMNNNLKNKSAKNESAKNQNNAKNINDKDVTNNNSHNDISRQNGVVLSKQSNKKLSFSTIAQNEMGYATPIDKATNTISEATTREIGVQKYLETNEIHHKETSTVAMETNSVGTCTPAPRKLVEFSCQSNIPLPSNDKQTETLRKVFSTQSCGGEDIAEKNFTDSSSQHAQVTCSKSSQSQPSVCEQGTMIGGAEQYKDKGVGEGRAVVGFCAKTTQSELETRENSTQASRAEVFSQSTSVGCSYSHLVDSSSQSSVETSDFSCGDNVAQKLFSEQSSCAKPSTAETSTETRRVEMMSQMTSCDVIKTIDASAGECTVNDNYCDRCTFLTTDEIGVGSYADDTPCSSDDKLCECEKPDTKTVGVGNHTINDVCCDRCQNLKTTSIGVGEDRIDGSLKCDKCSNLTTSTKAVGDCSTSDVVCDVCTNKTTAEIGVSEHTIHDSFCEFCDNRQTSEIGINVNENCPKCESSEDSGNNTFHFDVNILNTTSSNHGNNGCGNAPPDAQQAVLCHYCGNKVDLNDAHLDESLQAMRDSMKKVPSGMKRSTVSRTLNLDSQQSSHNALEDDDEYEEEDTHAEDYQVLNMSDDDESQQRSESDVIESCKALHAHFSGEKPLKQAAMVKYMGVIQTLWFKTLKKRRANAAVVKSYIDLFQQRIPELVETVINMADDEGNTAIHYAITYKNYSVVNILLDSGECALDFINQAGYSPIMLACLAGMAQKNDKYILQRLFRMGDINKPSAEVGETPLMLAVSRGKMGVVELLLDAGCDINATDDDGSTALMCACEQGNINIVKALLANPDCDVTLEDNEGSTALSISMDSRRKDLALLIYGSLNFDTRGRIKLSPSKQSLLGLGRRSPSPVIGKK